MADAACPGDVVAPATTPCGDQSQTICTDPDTCDGTGICGPNNVPCALVTDSSLCAFDIEPDKGTCVGGNLGGEPCSLANGNDDCVGGTCEQSTQFRNLLTPDGQNWVAFKLNANNPGQFFYNLISISEGSGTVTLTITVPYPFVTQGATPVHVYDGSLAIEDGCFMPDLALARSSVQITMDDWINGGMNNADLVCDTVCGPNGSGTCTFDVTATYPPVSGQLYVNVHLDYGLKGVQTDANPCGDDLADRYDPGTALSVWGSRDAYVNRADDGLVDLALTDCQNYEFSHKEDWTSDDFTDTVQNLNIFKPISGAFGLCNRSDNGDPCPENVAVELVRNSTSEVVQSTVTDEDGFYGLIYAHRGKPAFYTVFLLGDYNLSHKVKLNSKGWAEVNFDVYTGTSTATLSHGPKDDDGGGTCEPPLLPQGAACTDNAECCSNKCKGPASRRVCK